MTEAEEIRWAFEDWFFDADPPPWPDIVRVRQEAGYIQSFHVWTAACKWSRERKPPKTILTCPYCNMPEMGCYYDQTCPGCVERMGKTAIHPG